MRIALSKSLFVAMLIVAAHSSAQDSVPPPTLIPQDRTDMVAHTEAIDSARAAQKELIQKFKQERYKKTMEMLEKRKQQSQN